MILAFNLVLRNAISQLPEFIMPYRAKDHPLIKYCIPRRLVRRDATWLGESGVGGINDAVECDFMIIAH